MGVASGGSAALGKEGRDECGHVEGLLPHATPSIYKWLASICNWWACLLHMIRGCTAIPILFV
uniref:Uncharacterized protein n=1 Tax=Oryza rufipogon TaxID=4529 RepID=A0A0E0QWH2_ORYRU